VIDCLALTIIIRDRAVKPVGGLVSDSFYRNLNLYLKISLIHYAGSLSCFQISVQQPIKWHDPHSAGSSHSPDWLVIEMIYFSCVFIPE
jgi:hypothetical protein